MSRVIGAPAFAILQSLEVKLKHRVLGRGQERAPCQKAGAGRKAPKLITGSYRTSGPSHSSPQASAALQPCLVPNKPRCRTHLHTLPSLHKATDGVEGPRATGVQVRAVVEV